jgi:hypothetical protein
VSGLAAADNDIIVVITAPTVAIPPPVIAVPPPIITAPPPTVVVTPVPAPAPAVAMAPMPAAPAGTLVGAEGLTELDFVSRDPSEPLIISYYNEDPSVEDYVPVCVTPCAMQIPNGMYEFMAGRHRTFTVFAAGGLQHWRVDDNNLGGIITALGGITAIAGIASVGLTSDIGGDREPAYTVLGVGAGVTVLGLVIWLCSYGSAEMVQDSGGYIPVGNGVGLLPSVFMAQNEAGGRDWGLGLALRF